MVSPEVVTCSLRKHKRNLKQEEKGENVFNHAPYTLAKADSFVSLILL